MVRKGSKGRPPLWKLGGLASKSGKKRPLEGNCHQVGLQSGWLSVACSLHDGCFGTLLLARNNGNAKSYCIPVCMNIVTNTDDNIKSSKSGELRILNVFYVIWMGNGWKEK